MTTQARSLNQTQLIQHQRHQPCLQGKSVNVTNTLQDSHFDKIHQHHPKETTPDEMMIDGDERQKDITHEEIDYESQHNNSHQITCDIQSDDTEQSRHSSKDQIMQQQRQSSHLEENICAGCNKSIKDRYLLEALDKRWHEDCLKCAGCGCRLGELGSSLFINAGKILCKHDFLRIFGNEGCCAACKKSIPPYELVMRANKNAYHMDCFACQQCNYRFCVGDKFHLQDDHKIICLLCQCENESHMSSHTSGSTFSQSSLQFTSQENIYEQQNQHHFSPQNQQCNNIPPYQYNNQQCPIRSRQPTDLQNHYQVHYPKSQSNIISLKTNALTLNQPLQRLNDMLLVNNINEANGLGNSLVSHNDFVQHQNNHQSMYRPQHQLTMSHHGVSLPQQTQQNPPGLLQANSLTIPSINQHIQPRNPSFVSNNHNQPTNLSQVMNQSKQQVIIHHHQHSTEYNPEISTNSNNGSIMQQRNPNNLVPSQPSLATIHHRNRDYDSQDLRQFEQQQQTHSYLNIKDEQMKTTRRFFEISSPLLNGNQVKVIKPQNDNKDNSISIATTTSVCPATHPGYIKQQDDVTRADHQQTYVKNELIESSGSITSCEKVIENLMEVALSPSKIKRNERMASETADECEGSSELLDQSKIVTMNQPCKPANANCKKRKTRDDVASALSLGQTITIETLLQNDLCSETSEPNNIADVEDSSEQQLSADFCPIITINDNDRKESALDPHHQQAMKHQYMMSISDTIDHSSLDDDKASTSESSISLSESASSTRAVE